jgi:hypothetical protein
MGRGDVGANGATNLGRERAVVPLGFALELLAQRDRDEQADVRGAGSHEQAHRRSSEPIRSVRDVNAGAWIVLAFGAATVASQWYTARKTGGLAAEQVEAARRQAEAAELQTRAANIALDRELPLSSSRSGDWF